MRGESPVSAIQVACRKCGPCIVTEDRISLMVETTTGPSYGWTCLCGEAHAGRVTNAEFVTQLRAAGVAAPYCYTADFTDHPPASLPPLNAIELMLFRNALESMAFIAGHCEDEMTP
jgi:hypothetical protein